MKEHVEFKKWNSHHPFFSTLESDAGIFFSFLFDSNILKLLCAASVHLSTVIIFQPSFLTTESCNCASILVPKVKCFNFFFMFVGFQALDLKPNYVRAWANMGISYANQVWLTLIYSISTSLLLRTIGWRNNVLR